jgi:transposase
MGQQRDALRMFVPLMRVASQPLLEPACPIPGSTVLHADETPVAMLDPGSGKTRWAYVSAYTPGAFDPLLGVVYDICVSRAGRHAVKALGNWSGTLIVDDYAGYDVALKLESRVAAGCLAHCRRKFDELIEIKVSEVAQEAVMRIGRLCKIEREISSLSAHHGLWPSAKVSQSRTGRNCASGSSSNASGCPTGLPQPRRSTTHCDDGRY